MANLNYFYGQQMRWALNGVTCTAFGVNSLIQTSDAERQSAQALYPNQQGNTSIAVFYDFRTRGTFTYIPSNVVTSNGDLALSGYEPPVGTGIQVADSFDANDMVNATNFKVESVQERRNATGVAEVVVIAVAWDNIS